MFISKLPMTSNYHRKATHSTNFRNVEVAFKGPKAVAASLTMGKFRHHEL